MSLPALYAELRRIAARSGRRKVLAPSGTGQKQQKDECKTSHFLFLHLSGSLAGQFYRCLMTSMVSPDDRIAVAVTSQLDSTVSPAESCNRASLKFAISAKQEKLSLCLGLP